MKLSYTIFAFLFANVSICLAQDNPNQDFYAGEVSKMIHLPNSPEAQAFAKYGDTQVNMYSGVPQISIPLHTIEGRELNLPLSLTYDASGILVEQKATWVGLSWNLNVGGRISRTTNGLPDDYFERGILGSGYAYKTMFNDPGIGEEHTFSRVKRYIDDYVTNGSIPNFPNQTEAEEYFEFLYDVNKNDYDTQPDYFTLNVMGLNETIVFEQEFDSDSGLGYIQIPRVLNNPRIKVEPSYALYNTQLTINGVQDIRQYITSWKITGEDGTQYFFDEDEIEETVRTNNGDATPLGDLGTTKYTSSWVLTKIISKNRKDVYEFNYIDRGYEAQPTLPSSYGVETTVIQNDPVKFFYEEPTNNVPGNISSLIKQQYLSSIEHNGKKVAELFLGNRIDVQSNVANSRLASVDFFDTNENNLKTITFDNDAYFNSDAVNSGSFTDIRLKLNGLSIKGTDNVSYQDYFFDYIKPDDLPSRLSFAQDYLGYYNGADGNNTLYEQHTAGDVLFAGANRDLNCEFSMIGLLNQVTYPTGGRTVYTYESHDEFERTVTTIESAIASFTVSAATNVGLNLFNNPDGTPCDDIAKPPSQAPKVLIGTFRIDQAKEYFIKYEGGNGDRAIIVDPLAGPRTFKTYCDFNESIPAEYIIWDSDEDNNGNLLLDAKYKIYLFSNYESNNSNRWDTVSLNILEENTTTNDRNTEIGGHRIGKITDFSEGDKVAMTKFYSYKKDGQSTSSKKYLPILTQIPTHNEEQGASKNQVPKLVRSASFARGTEPYVVYSSVKEYKIDGSGAALGHTTYDFFGGAKGTTPNTNAPFENTYISSLKAGNVMEKSAYQQNGAIVSKETTEYFETLPRPLQVKGLVVYTEEANFDKAIFLKQFNPSGNSPYVAPEYKPGYTGCSGGNVGAVGQYGLLCALPDYWQNWQGEYLNKLPQTWAPYTARVTTATGVYGGVSMTKTETIFKDHNNNDITITSLEETEHDSIGNFYYLPRKKTVTDSKGDVYETSYTYGFERPNSPTTASLAIEGNNNLVEVAKTVTKKNPLLGDAAPVISSRENYYTIFPNVDVDTGEEFKVILPTTISTQKGSDIPEDQDDRVVFDFYLDGNLKTAKKTSGPTTVYVWGYNRMYPVAKIENTTVAQVQTILGLNEDLNLGVGGLSATQETDLRNGLPNAMVFTYSYLPSVGVSTMTDPRGYMIHYEYDNFNRLKLVKDAAGNLVTDYEYGYKQSVSN